MTDDEILLLYKATYERLDQRPWWEVKFAFARAMELAGKRAAYEDAARLCDERPDYYADYCASAIRARAAEVCK